MTNILAPKVFRFAKIFRFFIFSTSSFSGWGIACSLCYQSELPRPIKIRLGFVCGVELCMKLQHSVSWKCVRKIVQYHVKSARLKSILLVILSILSTSQIKFTCFHIILPWHLPFKNFICKIVVAVNFYTFELVIVFVMVSNDVIIM